MLAAIDALQAHVPTPIHSVYLQGGNVVGQKRTGKPREGKWQARGLTEILNRNNSQIRDIRYKDPPLRNARNAKIPDDYFILIVHIADIAWSK